MWKTTRFYIRFFFVFIKKYWLILSLSIVIGTATFWFLPKLTRFIPKIRQTESIGIVGRFQQNNLPAEILKQVSIGLTQIDEQGRSFPGLAQTWQTKDEGKEWIFKLDPEINWSDQQPVKSQDLQFTFKDVEIEYPDDNQILFRLQDPFSPFPNVVSFPVLRQDLTGIGPYKFTKINRVGPYIQSIKLTPVNKTSTKPNVKYQFYSTEESALTAFKLGEIQTIRDLLSPSEFQNWPNVTITENPQPLRYVGIFFNTNNPNFTDKSTRQALAYAIQDKSFGHERVISPIMTESWAYNSHVKPYEYDLERAKTLWGNFKLDEDSAIQISTVPSLLPIAEKISQDWQDFGIANQVRVINTIPEDYHVLLVTQEVPADPDQYVLWHSTQQTNITHYQNPKIDKLLEDGRKELDQDKRAEIYEDFQRTLLEDLPVIFLFRPVTYTISRNGLSFRAGEE